MTYAAAGCCSSGWTSSVTTSPKLTSPPPPALGRFQPRSDWTSAGSSWTPSSEPSVRALRDLAQLPPLESGRGGETAVDGDVLPGDERRLVAGQKQHQRGDLVGRAEPTQRRQQPIVAGKSRFFLLRATPPRSF